MNTLALSQGFATDSWSEWFFGLPVNGWLILGWLVVCIALMLWMGREAQGYSVVLVVISAGLFAASVLVFPGFLGFGTTTNYEKTPEQLQAWVHDTYGVDVSTGEAEDLLEHAVPTEKTVVNERTVVGNRMVTPVSTENGLLLFSDDSTELPRTK